MVQTIFTSQRNVIGGAGPGAWQGAVAQAPTPSVSIQGTWLASGCSCAMNTSHCDSCPRAKLTPPFSRKRLALAALPSSPASVFADAPCCASLSTMKS